MAEHKKKPTIAEARKAATARRKRTDARRAAEAAAKVKAAAPVVAEKSTGLIDRIRKAFSSADDIARIDAAVDAVTAGVDEANKGKKK